MKTFRKFLYGTLALVVALGIWIQIGSIDQNGFDDRGLLAELQPVPDAKVFPIQSPRQT